MPPSALPPLEFSRPVSLTRLTGHGLEIELRAEPDELDRIAHRLGVPQVGWLEARFSLRRLAAGIVEADGVLTARVVQQCVVSLEPVEQSVDERFEVRFVPEQTGSAETGTDELLDPDSIDEIPYQGDRIDLGEACVEQLALALDPFPRQPGIALPSGMSDTMDKPDGGSVTIHQVASLRARRDAT